MKLETIIIIILILAAGVGIVWSVISFVGDDSLSPTANTAVNYQRAKNAELPDKCQTPEGYTDEEWQTHMSHHPDRYKECLQGVDMTEINRKDINVNDLKLMLENKDFTLIDVHIPEQVHVPGTDAMIPFNQIGSRVNELPVDKNSKIVLYCRSGNMSQTAAKTLIEMGYTNVYNVVGGMNAWQGAGYEIDATLMQ